MKTQTRHIAGYRKSGSPDGSKHVLGEGMKSYLRGGGRVQRRGGHWALGAWGT